MSSSSCVQNYAFHTAATLGLILAMVKKFAVKFIKFRVAADLTDKETDLVRSTNLCSLTTMGHALSQVSKITCSSRLPLTFAKVMHAYITIGGQRAFT